ncbi:MAG: protein phosphatase 2C domain-containing protein [Actinomycetota bacterium]
MTLGIRYAARSDVGLLREINEDAAYAGPRLIAVADGMGGHAAGEVASAVAIAALAALDRDLPEDEPRDEADPRELLRGAVLSANTRLREMVATDRELDGMGTTVTAVLVDRKQFALVHIGDSRAYRLRAGELRQVTRDHTLVQRLVDEGRITAEEAGVHPQRALVTNALDGREGLELDLSMHDLVLGDRYLLCSDGLSAVVSDPTIRESLTLPDPRRAVDRLVELALRGGAPDNVTCVVADVVEVEEMTQPVGGQAAVRVVAGSAAEGPQAVTGTKGLRKDATARTGDHAAGRAAGLRLPGVTERAAHVRRRQRWLIALALAVAMLIGAAVGWSYVQSQYYVGASGTDVTIFRGVHGRFAGLDLSHTTNEPRIPLASLGEFQQRRVQAGINAASLSDARGIVARLTSESAAQPANPLPSGSATPLPSPTEAASAAPSSAPGATPSETNAPIQPGAGSSTP